MYRPAPRDHEDVWLAALGPLTSSEAGVNPQASGGQGDRMNAAAKRLMRAGNGLAVFLYRRSKGRIGGTARGRTPVLLLTVPGRKTGTPHTTPVSYLADEGGYVGHWYSRRGEAGPPVVPQPARSFPCARRVGSPAPGCRRACGVGGGARPSLARGRPGPGAVIRRVRGKVRTCDPCRTAHAGMTSVRVTPDSSAAEVSRRSPHTHKIPADAGRPR